MRLLYAILPPDVPVSFLIINTDILVWRIVEKKYYTLKEGILTIDNTFNEIVLNSQYLLRIEIEPTVAELRQRNAHLN